MMNKNTSSNSRKFLHTIYVIGIVCVIIGSFGHFFVLPPFKFLFAIGALLVIISQVINASVNTEVNFRKKRLLKMNVMLSLMLALATYSMFDGTTLWVVMVLIYALVTLMMSFRV